MFAAPNGKAFCAGPLREGRYLDPAFVNTTTNTIGRWESTIYNTNYNPGSGIIRGAGSAVMYAKGRILIVGGTGLNNQSTPTAEWIDLTATTPVWRTAGTMQFARQHLNATLLPTGQVLITGGSRTSTNYEYDAVLPAELSVDATRCRHHRPRHLADAGLDAGATPLPLYGRAAARWARTEYGLRRAGQFHFAHRLRGVFAAVPVRGRAAPAAYGLAGGGEVWARLFGFGGAHYPGHHHRQGAALATGLRHVRLRPEPARP